MHDDAAYRESLSSSCHISPAKSRLIGVLTARRFGGYGFLAAHCALLLTHTLPEQDVKNNTGRTAVFKTQAKLLVAKGISNTLDKQVIAAPRHRPEQSGRTGDDAEPV